MDIVSSTPVVRDRVERLFKYLGERSRLRTKVVTDILNSRAYDPVLWLEEVLPNEPEVWSIYRDEPDTTDEEDVDDSGEADTAQLEQELIRVQRVTVPAAPDPPEDCEEWIRSGTKSVDDWVNGPPALLEHLLIDNPAYDPEKPDSNQTQYLERKLVDHPAIGAAWKTYLETNWRPWQGERRRLAPILRVYGLLFELRSILERDEEEYELIVGSELLTWWPDGASSSPIYRHLVTLAVRIELDSATGTLRVMSAQDAPAPRLETDMLPPALTPPLDGLTDIEKGELGDTRMLVPSPLHGRTVTDTLRPWANRLHAEAKVLLSTRQPNRPSQRIAPLLAFAPALILRKRPATSLTAAFEQCEQQVREGGVVPFNVARVVEQIEEAPITAGTSGERDSGSAQDADDEPLFPRPSNDEQYRIAKRLMRSKGVLVQGPPGTGKTHTIANLICHLLAQGKRILVTSAKARPLTVLHDKLPDEVKPLCLTSLGGGRDEADQLKRSVTGILRHFEEYNRDENIQRVKELTRLIKEKRARISELLNMRRHRLELETARQSLADGAYSGSAMEIIAAVREDERRFGWFADDMPTDKRCPLPISWEQSVANALRAVPAPLRPELELAVPTLSALSDPTDFRAMADRESHLNGELPRLIAAIREKEESLKVRQRVETLNLAVDIEKARAALFEAENQLASARRRAERERVQVNRQIEALRSAHQLKLNEQMLEFDRRQASLKTEAIRVVNSKPQRDVGKGGQLAAALWDMDLDALRTAASQVDALKQAIDHMGGKGWNWPKRAAVECLTGNSMKWRRHLEDVRTVAATLPDLAVLKAMDDLRIRTPEIPADAKLTDDAEERLRFFDAGGSKGILFKPPVVKRTQYVEAASVDGVPCSKNEALRQFVQYLKAERQVDRLAQLWAPFSRRWAQRKSDEPLYVTLDSAIQCAAGLEQVLTATEHARHDAPNPTALATDIVAWADVIAEQLRARTRYEADHAKWAAWRGETSRKVEEVLADRNAVAANLEKQLQTEIGRLESGIAAVDETRFQDAAHETQLLENQLTEQRERIADREEGNIAPLRRDRLHVESELAAIRRSRDTTRQAALLASHAPKPHPSCAAIVAAVDAADSDGYAVSHGRLQQLELFRPAHQALMLLLNPLGDVAPKAAQHVGSQDGPESIGGTLNDFRAAWNWARAKRWMTDFRAGGLPAVDEEFARAEAAVNDAIASKAALLAWRHCRESSTQKQQEALKAWEKAVKKIGKGKGKYAARHRRHALKHMRVAQGMIPALVTPLARLVESLPIRPQMFDVVIVDEASQLGPEGLLLFYVGDQIVVVGDDEQISPEDVGLDLSQVHALIQRHLKDVAIRDSLEGSSLFDQADVRFTEGRIMLREHFRCVPEIIAFSNQLAYRDETNSPMLIPLRKVTGKRLHPALRTVFVPSGFKAETGVNEPEADAIVSAMVECHHDLQYDGKLFGVISLLGKPQADYIYRRLSDALGTEALESRNVVCGDAYSFQGDERHVMFLSMVVASNAPYSALTKRTDRQRFNVAASRAQDQMWLFHSVALNDLKPDDFRHQLLDHCMAVEEQRAYLLEDELKKCGSGFEREVARRIWAKGYRVRCQEGVAHYRIDLVVEGSNGTHLAVECDGDQYHPPEQYDQDVRRQRNLERCGWRFWRVWGSDFAADPDAALESLWNTLADLGVEKAT